CDISIVTSNMAARDPDDDLSEAMAAASVTSRGRLNLPYYKMDAVPRGICVIINNHSFYRESKASAESLDEREGTHVDRGHVELQADAKERDRLRLIPNEADFLVSYATVPGYVSWRNTREGSWFIGKLTELLDNYGHDHEIGDILTGVKLEVGDRSTVRLQYKQAPVEMNALRKKLVFGQIHSQTSSASAIKPGFHNVVLRVMSDMTRYVYECEFSRRPDSNNWCRLVLVFLTSLIFGAAVTEPSRSEETVGNKGEKPRPPEPEQKRTGE
ncbi:hypothetical protein BaRGS_00029229, partial [Batillaria attramentaria]